MYSALVLVAALAGRARAPGRRGWASRARRAHAAPRASPGGRTRGSRRGLSRTRPACRRHGAAPCGHSSPGSCQLACHGQRRPSRACGRVRRAPPRSGSAARLPPCSSRGSPRTASTSTAVRQVAPTWESLVDRQIREAMEDGRFDDLPHQGEPLPVEDETYAGEWALAFRMLRNAGVAPPWIEADKEVRALLARRDAIVAGARGALVRVRARARPGGARAARRPRSTRPSPGSTPRRRPTGSTARRCGSRSSWRGSMTRLVPTGRPGHDRRARARDRHGPARRARRRGRDPRGRPRRVARRRTTS